MPSAVKEKEDKKHAEKAEKAEKVEKAEKPEKAEKLGFAAGDLVVYPTHGVGKIMAVENQEIAGYTLNVFVVHFDKTA